MPGEKTVEISTNQVKRLTKSSSPKSALAPQKAKRNGFETVSQFIYWII